MDLMDGQEDRPRGSETGQPNQLLDRIDELITAKLSSFQDSLSKSQKDVAESVLNSSGYTFKRKSCEDQFKFNTQVNSKLVQADSALKSGRQDKALESISEGMTLLHDRQKIIKLADSSDLGWSVAKEYQSNPLASDSEDERKMLRAESRAIRKQKRNRRHKPYFNPNYNPNYNQNSVPAQHTPMQGQNISSVVGKGRRPGLCFDCGKPGHWRGECRQGERDKGIDKISVDYLCLNNGPSRNVLNVALPVLAKNSNKVELGFSPSNDGQKLSPVGRLKGKIKEWEGIGSSDYIMSLIRFGYKLPFKTLPVISYARNNLSARSDASFVSSEICRLLELGCVSKVNTRPCVVNPLTVAYGKKGKARLVLDCRLINDHLVKFKFQYEDIQVAKQLLHDSEFLFTFDLQSAYHIVEIFNEHRTYLGFSWPDSTGREQFYVFNVLPFGISTASHIFTKLMRVPVAYLRGKGHKIVMFLDDGLGGHADKQNASKLSRLVRDFLLNLGFLIAENKCCWEPSHRAEWLGHIWDMFNNSLKVTESRVSRLNTHLDSLFAELKIRSLHIVRVRFLAGIVGQIVSMSNALGKKVFLKTRYLYKCIDTRLDWNSFVYVDDDALSELHFWRENCGKLNEHGNPIAGELNGELSCFSDASASGYGGYVALCVGTLVEGSELCGLWNASEKMKSSTWRELASVERVLKSNKGMLKGKYVDMFCDNKNAVGILSKGSKNADLQTLSLSINSFCNDSKITLLPHWVPRADNILADRMSRTYDNDDWAISNEIYHQLNVCWGPFTVDRFANAMNAKCDRFNCSTWSPGCEAVDAFTVSWKGENNWCVPPPKLIAKALIKLIKDNAEGTFVLPSWKSAPFWSLLFDSENNYKSFVEDMIILPRTNTVQQGYGNNGIFAESPLRFDMIAVRIRKRSI